MRRQPRRFLLPLNLVPTVQPLHHCYSFRRIDESTCKTMTIVLLLIISNLVTRRAFLRSTNGSGQSPLVCNIPLPKIYFLIRFQAMSFRKTLNLPSIPFMPSLHSFKINTWEQLSNAQICGGVKECNLSSRRSIPHSSILKDFLDCGCGLCFVQDLDTPQEPFLI